DQRAIPTADPWMPLAEGMPAVDNAWLSQVLFALVHRAAGPEALSPLFALTGLARYPLSTRAYYLRAGHAAAALLTAVGVVVIGWSRIATIRPENFAVLALAALLWLLAGGRRAAETAGEGEAAEDSSNNAPFPRAAWLAVPLLFALWANLHG